MKHFSAKIQDAWIIDYVRTPFVDYCGAMGAVSPTDMGIKVARAALERSGVSATDVDRSSPAPWRRPTLTPLC